MAGKLGADFNANTPSDDDAVKWGAQAIRDIKARLKAWASQIFDLDSGQLKDNVVGSSKLANLQPSPAGTWDSVTVNEKGQVTGGAAGSIPATGAAKTFLRRNAGGTANEFRTADLADITAVGSAPGQVPIRNGGGTGWSWHTPITQTALPTFIAAVTVHSGGAVAWTTYNSSPSTLGGKIAAILTIETFANGGLTTVTVRKDSTGVEMLVGKSQGDSGGDAGQVIVPLKTDGSFEYKVELTASGNAAIKLVGYIG
jgi:hypothetical protein